MGNYLGQHFLINKKKIEKIIEALDLKSGDVVVEIGPGKGALTIPLCENCQKLGCKIIAVEKDKDLADDLKNKIYDLGLDKNIEIIEGDALKTLPRLIHNSELRIKNYKIVGNIPYYITGYLLRILGELENKPSLIVLTIQKEVAQRVCAKPRTRRRQGYGGQGMNLLAASVQFWAEPKIIGSVSKKDFWPIPKVDSAIIKLTPLTLLVRSSTQCNKGDYYKFIKILFKQPRKTILNNLKSQISNLKNKEKIIEKLKKVGVDPQARPQNLSIEQILKLFNFLKYCFL